MILTRSPLTHVTRRSSAFDLHVLGPPPAFVLSQDQTLRQNLQPAPPKRCRPSNQWCDTTRRCCRREFEVDRDTNPGRPGTGQWWSAETGHRCPFSAIEIVQGLSSDDSRSSGGQPALAFSSSIPFSRSTWRPGASRHTPKIAGRIPAEAVVPSTRHSDSIRLDLPLGGRPRYGDDFARSRTSPAPVSRETLSLPPMGANPRSPDFRPKRHFFNVISVVREPRGRQEFSRPPGDGDSDAPSEVARTGPQPGHRPEGPGRRDPCLLYTSPSPRD